jgi:hypothetical protein
VTLVIETPTPLFELTEASGVTVGDAGFDVAPDGTRFVMVRPGVRTDQPARRMILVQNWFEEFRER